MSRDELTAAILPILPATPRRIRDATGLKLGHVSGMLSFLQAEGLIEKKRGVWQRTASRLGVWAVPIGGGWYANVKALVQPHPDALFLGAAE